MARPGPLPGAGKVEGRVVSAPSPDTGPRRGSLRRLLFVAEPILMVLGSGLAVALMLRLSEALR